MNKLKLNVSKFCKELKILLKKYNATLGVDINGDTHGIDTNFIVQDSNGKDYILNHYTAYIDHSDL